VGKKKEYLRGKAVSKNGEKFGGFSILIHHLFVIMSCFFYLGVRKMGSFCVAAMFFMEFSAIFMHLRWILIKYKMGPSSIFHINNLCLVISFTTTRLLVWPYLIYKYTIFLDVPFIQVLFTIPRSCVYGISFLIIINSYWLGLMACSFVKPSNNHLQTI